MSYRILWITLFCISACQMSQAASDKEILEKLNTNSISSFQINYDTIHERSIRVVVEDEQADDSTLLVFVHGAPGDWKAYEAYMMDSTLLSNARLISYDRPGYGASGKQPMTSIKDQANILLGLVEKYKLPKVVLVGHSYGGPIVGISSIIGSDIVDLSIMISPLNDPENEPIFWVSYLAKWKLTKWLVPKDLRTAGAEKFAHAKALEEVKHLWSTTTQKIVHIHGDIDFIAPADANIAFSKTYIPDEYLDLRIIEDENHLILFFKSRLMRDMIMEFL